MIKLLPHWCLPTSQPAFYDTDSKTAIEMVSNLYGKMNELVTDYNTFIDNVNKKIIEFAEDTEKDLEAFKVGLRQEFQDFIDVVNLKMLALDMKTEEINAKFEQLNNELLEAIDQINNLENEADALMEQILANSQNYLEENVNRIVTELYNQSIANGVLQVGVTYDEVNEELTIHTNVEDVSEVDY